MSIRSIAAKLKISKTTVMKIKRSIALDTSSNA
ncbi:MAG: hypothetical protein K2X77_23050 [Candidatus Obscuribacterales bacterium]|nr:hypothetical protein [Candidatus Obscuribacterales bacterium]